MSFMREAGDPRAEVIMPECDVVIQNNSGSDHDYIFYSDPPGVAGVKKFTQHVFAVAQNVPNNGNKVIRLKSPTYAIWGEDVGGGSFSSSAKKPFKLANPFGRGGTVISFDTDVRGQMVFREHAFEIMCGPEFEENAVGVSVEGEDGRVTPVATWKPRPNTDYTIYPRDKSVYCAAVTKGYGHMGEPVRFADLKGDIAKMQLSEMAVILIHGPDGKFSRQGEGETKVEG